MTTWTAENTANFTPEDIARYLPPSWAFTFVSLDAAMNYYHPEGVAR